MWLWNLPVEELIQIVADGFTEAISDRQPRLDSELSTLDPELPLQKLFVRNLLMIAFNKHDWSWFGECQVDPAQSNLCTGCFRGNWGMVARRG